MSVRDTSTPACQGGQRAFSPLPRRRIAVQFNCTYPLFRTRKSGRAISPVFAVSGSELAQLAAASSATVQTAVNSVVAVLPPAVQPVVSTLGTDIAGVVGLSPSLPGVGRLAAVYYAFFTRPGPVVGEHDKRERFSCRTSTIMLLVHHLE